MAKETAPTTEQLTPGVTPEQIKEILRHNEQLMKSVESLSKVITSYEQKVPEPAPKDIVHDVQEPIETPRRLKFKISAYEPEDAVVDGMIVPGKKIVGAFKYTSEIGMDGNDAYRTGFELDQLEMESDLKGEELINYQKDVRIARRYVERVTGQSLSNLNKTFWRNKSIVVDNLELEYDTQLVDNLIKYYNILGGAFPSIAKNLQDAQDTQKLLYLDVASQEVKSRTSLTMSKMDAVSILKEIRDTWKAKDTLLLIYALSDKKTHGYTFDTPKETLIEELQNYIDGVGTTTEKKRRPKAFMEAVEKMKSSTEGERFRTQGLLKAGLYYGFVYQNKEKAFILKDSDSTLGSSLKSSVEYLINPVNLDDFGSLMASVTKKWTD